MRELVIEGQEGEKPIQGKHPGGRPTKLTRELIGKIAEHVKGGNYMETSAAYVGVSRETLYEWLRRGAAARSGLYREFSDTMETALAAAEIDPLKIITEAGQKQWQALAWRLERRFPHRWGKLDRIEHTGADGKDLFSPDALLAHPTLASLPIENRRAVAAGLRKILPALAAMAGQDDEDAVDGEGVVVEEPSREATEEESQ